jgi:hypothetical protein
MMHEPNHTPCIVQQMLNLQLHASPPTLALKQIIGPTHTKMSQLFTCMIHNVFPPL